MATTTTEPIIGNMGVITSPPEKDADAIKLFVGNLPRHYVETDVRKVFEPIGPIHEIFVMTDKITGQGKGCAFVTFCKREHCLKAIEQMHEKTTLPGAQYPVQVKVAHSEEKAEERNIFVGSLPREYTENELQTMFKPFGNIESCIILRDRVDGSSKGCGFVKMETRAGALHAIDTLHQSTTLEGAKAPLVVKFSDTEKEKEQKRKMKMLEQMGGMNPYGMGYGMNPMGMMGGGAMNPMMMGGAQGMGGMGGGGMGSMGGMGQMQPQQQQQGMGMGGGMDMSQAYAGLQMYSSGLGTQPYQQQGMGGSMRPTSGHHEGPDGCNLFIYHLPSQFDDNALLMTFSPFGVVVSAKVFIDKQTGMSKGFGFVSYNNAASAQAAIQAMNGFQVANKRLKVQLKKPRGAPY